MILRLKPDPANIIVDVIFWFYRVIRWILAVELPNIFLAILVCSIQKNSSKFLDTVDVNSKIHNTA